MSIPNSRCEAPPSVRHSKNARKAPPNPGRMERSGVEPVVASSDIHTGETIVDWKHLCQFRSKLSKVGLPESVPFTTPGFFDRPRLPETGPSTEPVWRSFQS